MGARLQFDHALKEAEDTGSPHSEVCFTIQNSIAVLCMDINSLGEAQQYFEMALKGRTKLLGDKHPDTLRTLNGLGKLMLKLEDFMAASSYLQKALEGREIALGTNHPSTIATVFALGNLHMRTGATNEALDLFERARSGYLEAYGPAHPDTWAAVKACAELLQDQGQLSQEQILLEESLMNASTLLGPEHDATLQQANYLFNFFKNVRALPLKAKEIADKYPLEKVSINASTSWRRKTWASSDLTRRPPKLEEKVLPPLLPIRSGSCQGSHPLQIIHNNSVNFASTKKLLQRSQSTRQNTSTSTVQQNTSASSTVSRENNTRIRLTRFLIRPLRNLFPDRSGISPKTET